MSLEDTEYDFFVHVPNLWMLMLVRAKMVEIKPTHSGPANPHHLLPDIFRLD